MLASRLLHEAKTDDSLVVIDFVLGETAEYSGAIDVVLFVDGKAGIGEAWKEARSDSGLAIYCPHFTCRHFFSLTHPICFCLHRIASRHSRNFTRSAVLSDDDLPYHIVVGMPALSPTMETGTLTEWYVEEGGGFSAGESIAKIETDKASIDFEAQDDGFIGKLCGTKQRNTSARVD